MLSLSRVRVAQHRTPYSAWIDYRVPHTSCCSPVVISKMVEGKKRPAREPDDDPGPVTPEKKTEEKAAMSLCEELGNRV